MNDKELIEKLRSRKDGLDKLLADTKVVEDVISNNIKKTNRKASLKATGIDMPVAAVAAAMEAGVQTYAGQFEYFESSYIPRNSNEHPAEYRKRLHLTPIFTETPNILQSRIGSMFKKPPVIDLPDALEADENSFVNKATLSGQSLMDVINRVFDRSQVNGFCGVLVDRASVPEDMQDRDISAAERKAKKPGRPILAVYTAWQILDWEEDENGLKWVKLLEVCDEKQGWDKDPIRVEYIRIVDRKNISVYTITTEKGKDPVVKLESVTPHKAPPGDDGLPVCPFFLANPFPAEDGVGRSVLRGTAEADVAAVRVMSDLMWLLHMTAPLLVLNSNREEGEIGDIGLGSTRYNVIKAGGPDEREDIRFVQLDCQAIDRLSVHYDKLTAKAREQADRMNMGAITGAGEVSGVSKAWSFKTSEERILYLFGHHLQGLFQKLLELVARMEGYDESEVSIKFPDSYDIQGPTDLLAQAERALDIFKLYNQRKASALLLERLTQSVLQNPNQADWDIIEAEIKKEVEEADDLREFDSMGMPETKTGNGNWKKKSDVRQGSTDKADAEGEDKEDRSEGDKEDYQDNKKS